jgi:5-methylcytosine-specific restriction protein A
MSEKGSKTKRNPDWARDELILALDLYFRIDAARTNNANPEIVAVSEILKAMPIHPAFRGTPNFRNPHSVYMKLSNFLALDPDYNGEGLPKGSKLDEIVWDEFAGNRAQLATLAKLIKASVADPAIGDPEVLADEEEFPEGRIIARVHKMRERNKGLVRKKKAQVIQKFGRLRCEVCGFDFAKVYGELGEGFIECHHTKPLSELSPVGKTALRDLALVCANCHRILHRSRPWKTIRQLSDSLSKPEN